MFSNLSPTADSRISTEHSAYWTHIGNSDRNLSSAPWRRREKGDFPVDLCCETFSLPAGPDSSAPTSSRLAGRGARPPDRSIDKGTYAAASNGVSESGWRRALSPVRGRYCRPRADKDLAAGASAGSSVINFAAETHVDQVDHLSRKEFTCQANVMGTFNLLDEVRHYWRGLPDADKSAFRFLKVSTDEVYGSLPADEPPCDEERATAPNSPHMRRVKRRRISSCARSIRPMGYRRRLRDVATIMGLISIRRS